MQPKYQNSSLETQQIAYVLLIEVLIKASPCFHSTLVHAFLNIRLVVYMLILSLLKSTEILEKA